MGIGYICKSCLAQKQENYFSISVKDCKPWVSCSRVISHAPDDLHLGRSIFAPVFRGEIPVLIAFLEVAYLFLYFDFCTEPRSP